VLFFLTTRCQIKGRENVPEQGPLLVVSNHLSIADPPLLVLGLGRRSMFMAKKQLFRFKPMGWLLHGLGAFPVHRGRLDRQALRRANRVMDEGQVLVMFPEGMRSRSGQLRPAFNGAALIASRSRVTVLPVGISGSEQLEDLSRCWRRPRVTVNIGRPFYLPPAGSKLTRQELAEFTGSVMQHVAELLPPDYRGGYNGD